MLLHHLSEILGIDDLTSETRQVIRDGRPKHLIADQVTEHVEATGATGVLVVIVHVPGGVVRAGDDGSDVARLALLHVHFSTQINIV
jgi:hypothetical protein